MKDFIFGSLATEEQRLDHERRLLAGVTHRSLRSPRDPLPGQPVDLELAVGPGCPATAAWAYYTTDGTDPAGAFGSPTNGSALAMRPERSEWNTLDWGYVRRYHVRIPAQPADRVVRYRLSAVVADQLEVFADQGAYYAYLVADDPLPAWTRQAIVYHIFVDRFSPGQNQPWLRPDRLDGIFGGTLRGISDQLDYFTQLGVNTLYLSPIFPSASHHGYNASDYFSIEPRLGSQADFRHLLDTAHSRGLRVLLDFVPNHWSDEHATFQQAIADPASPYREWYSFSRYPDEYAGFFGVKCMPQINLRNPAARQHVLDSVRHWLELGVDGYRLDYAIGPSPDFWAEFRKTVRAAKPDAWIFGEVVDPPDAQLAFEGLLDGCLDFMLLEALRQTFAFGAWPAAQFAAFLASHQAYFPPEFSRPSFLDNHDMDRFLWAAQGDVRRLKLSALCQFTLSGPPMIYYGTEVGLSQERGVRAAGGTFGYLEEARLPMLWGDAQDRAMFAYYQALIGLRAAHPCLSTGEWAPGVQSQDTFTYIRSDSAERLLVAFNLSSEPRRLEIPGAWSAVIFSTGPAPSVAPREDCLVVELAPMTGAVIR